MKMGYAIRGGLAHQIKTCDARYWSACIPRFLGRILKIDMICSDMIDIIFLVNTYHRRIDLDLTDL